MAVDRGVLLAYAPGSDDQVRLTSRSFTGEVRFSLRAVPAMQPGDWGNFPRGAARALQQSYKVNRGLVGISSGSIHEGGLSSSAAIGVACLLALEEVNGLAVSPAENVMLDQHLENVYLGLRNGILDQAAILMSKRNQLTVVNCAIPEYHVVAPRADQRPFAILLAFSGLKKALVGTDYNRRVDECAAASQILLAACGRMSDRPRLGHVTAAEYAAHRHLLAGAAAKRAEHFFSESQRVADGIAAWSVGNLGEFGRLMTASGESSIINYECGAPPLVELYEILIRTPGVWAARFSGAGFRGCCVALVEPEAATDAAEQVAREYAARRPELAAAVELPVRCHSADGARASFSFDLERKMWERKIEDGGAGNKVAIHFPFPHLPFHFFALCSFPNRREVDHGPPDVDPLNGF